MSLKSAAESASIAFNVTIPPQVVREYFDGQAKVEAAKRRESSSFDWSGVGSALLALAPLLAPLAVSYLSSSAQEKESTPKPSTVKHYSTKKENGAIMIDCGYGVEGLERALREVDTSRSNIINSAAEKLASFINHMITLHPTVKLDDGVLKVHGATVLLRDGRAVPGDTKSIGKVASTTLSEIMKLFDHQKPSEPSQDVFIPEARPILATLLRVAQHVDVDTGKLSLNDEELAATINECLKLCPGSDKLDDGKLRLNEACVVFKNGVAVPFKSTVPCEEKASAVSSTATPSSGSSGEKKDVVSSPPPNQAVGGLQDIMKMFAPMLEGLSVGMGGLAKPSEGGTGTSEAADSSGSNISEDKGKGEEEASKREVSVSKQGGALPFDGSKIDFSQMGNGGINDIFKMLGPMLQGLAPSTAPISQSSSSSTSSATAGSPAVATKLSTEVSANPVTPSTDSFAEEAKSLIEEARAFAKESTGSEEASTAGKKKGKKQAAK